MRGKWALGLRPRNFTWVVQDRFAISERPGGFARNHRKVRRQEECLWLKGNGFTNVVSILKGPHNLHVYEDMEVPFLHVPLMDGDDLAPSLAQIFITIAKLMDDPEELVLMHYEEFGDIILGVSAGYLLYVGMVQNPGHAIQLMERHTKRVLGPDARLIVQTTFEEQLRRP